MAELLKILSVFITCALVFGKIGMPAAVLLFKFNFMKVFLVSSAGGITGVVVFTYLSASFLKWYHQLRVKNGRIHRKRIFTKFNRRVIMVKQRFGLVGIALITPPLLSPPLGAFLAERFFRDKRKVIVYLSISTMIWSVAIYSIMYLFH